jgi:LytS/YehU family sensor histidine kinase
MLFQQLVENAVKHGIGYGVPGGEVRVEALLDKSHLILITVNPGTYTEGPHDGQGIQNIREQLDSIFGSEASFHIRNTAEGVVRAEVRIPLNANRSIDRV